MKIELSIPQDFLDLLSWIGGIFYGDIKERFVKRICTDSRECQPGDIFFALEGKRLDGNKFIPDAIRRGAIPVGRGVGRYGIRVSSGEEALLSCASYYKNTLPHLIHTVAITGSVGKTTTKEFLKCLCSRKYKTHATWRNYNNGIGAAMTVLSAPSDTEVLILEFGMNHKGEIGRLSSAFAPNSAVITKIGSAHIGHLGSLENIAKAKLEITDGLRGRLFLPFEEALLSTNYRNVKHFSSKSPLADVSVVKNSFNQLELYTGGELNSIFDFQNKADHFLECLSAAIISAIEIGIEPGEIIKGICDINDDSFRHKILKSTLGYTILDDSYNASYESVRSALDMMNGIAGVKRRNILLGDILELGDMSYDIHYSVGRLASFYGLHYLFLLGEYAEAVFDGAVRGGFDKERVFILNDLSSPEKISEFIKSKMQADDIILVKGSHAMNLGRISELIR